MPIGTQYSSRLAKVAASYPADPLDLLSPTHLYVTSFDKQKASKQEAKLYVQGLPSTRFVGVDPLLWTYNISMPILVGTSGVRTEELTFWQQWVKYWRASKDSPGYMSGIPSSIVVTHAGIECTVDSASLVLGLVSNFELPSQIDEEGNTLAGWQYEFSSGDYQAYEGAYSPHLMAELRPFNDPNPLVPPTDWGWKDLYMITSLSGKFQTDYEMVNASQNPTSLNLAYAHIPDMLVVKGIKADGSIELFGARDNVLATSSQIFGYFVIDTPVPDPLLGGYPLGGIQIWVANRDEAGNVPNPILLELPSGLMVGNSQIQAQAGDVIKIKKDFINLFTDY